MIGTILVGIARLGQIQWNGLIGLLDKELRLINFGVHHRNFNIEAITLIKFFDRANRANRRVATVCNQQFRDRLRTTLRWSPVSVSVST